MKHFPAATATMTAIARALVCLLLFCALTISAQTKPKWELTWSDEFNAPNGAPVDPAKWTADIGGSGWGNQELEYYTDDPRNAHQENGKLVITALRETHTGSEGVTREYTSARLKTQGKFSQAYGRFEARIKLPIGRGIWPAFWLLGDNIRQVNWPDCGEIDIMENLGSEPQIVHGTIHGPGYSGEHGIGAAFHLKGLHRFTDGFHLFAVEWEPHEIRFYVDNNLYETRRPSDLPSGTKWVFDHPFFILLNVAVGGGWPGSPDQATRFPQKMLVDYVRVYRRANR